MTEAKIDNLLQLLQNFLKFYSRDYPLKAGEPITFKLDYKSTLKVSDSSASYSVDESYLNDYEDIYKDKQYNQVIIGNWEFDLEFVGKKCSQVTFIGTHVVFVGKNKKKDLSSILFKINIDQVSKLNKETQGYLNRIGKKNLCNQSVNHSKEYKSMNGFTPIVTSQTPSFNFKQWSKEDEAINPRNAVNAEGRKVIQKLKHFITRESIGELLLQVEFEESSLKKFIFKNEGVKKRNPKSVGESALKSIHE